MTCAAGALGTAGGFVRDGRVGRHSRVLQQLYFRAVRGEEPRYRDWLTPVYG